MRDSWESAIRKGTGRGQAARNLAWWDRKKRSVACNFNLNCHVWPQWDDAICMLKLEVDENLSHEHVSLNSRRWKGKQCGIRKEDTSLEMLGERGSWPAQAGLMDFLHHCWGWGFPDRGQLWTVWHFKIIILAAVLIMCHRQPEGRTVTLQCSRKQRKQQSGDQIWKWWQAVFSKS